MKHHVNELTEPGWVILAAVTMLVCIGLASIYVTDTHYVAGHDGPLNAGKQALHAVVGLMLGALILRLGYPRIARYSYALLAIGVVFLVPLLLAKLTHSTFGGMIVPRNGAYRWIQFPGFQMQPSEFFKLAYVLSLAWYLRYRRNYRRFGGLLLPFAVSIVPFALILFEPDLGTVMLLVPVLFVMLFLAGARIRHLLIITLLGAALVPLAWGKIKGYQRARVAAVLLQSDTLRQAVINNPDDWEFLATRRQALEWAANSGYQMVHSKNAVGSGGFLGYGWGDGVYVTHTLLPDRHNDFIFAVIAHQWGWLGSMLVLACYAVIIIAGTRIALGTVEPFGRLLAGGVVTLLAVQVLINIGMTTGLVPITGMTLPFVSYGGSSLLISFAAAALLVSVSQHRPFLLATRPFEFAGRSRPRPHLSELAESAS